MECCKKSRPMDIPVSNILNIFQFSLAHTILGDMDFTMLCQMSRRAYVDALLHDGDLNNLGNILEPLNASANGSSAPLKPTEAAEFLIKAPCLAEDDYNRLLHFLQHTGRPYRAYYSFPHPPNALILPPNAQCPHQLHRDEHTFSCESSHKGNSAIQYYNTMN